MSISASLSTISFLAFSEQVNYSCYPIYCILHTVYYGTMRLTICGSITFHDEMKQLQKELELLGHTVKIPRIQVPDKSGVLIPAKEFYVKYKKTAKPTDTWIWDRVKQSITLHFRKIAWSQAILVANYEKNDIKNYIGGNTLMEMGLALYLKKKIFLLNPIPEVSYKEELIALQPTIIYGDLTNIR